MTADTGRCAQCPTLRAQVAQQQQVIAHLRDRVEYLQQQIGFLAGGVRATVEFIDREASEPTMPRRQLLPGVHQRLTYLLDRTDGRRV